MFSRKTVLILAGILLLTVNLVMLAVTTRRPAASGLGRMMIAFVAPFQELATHVVKTVQDSWWRYFFLVSVARENQLLLQQLAESQQSIIQQRELEFEAIEQLPPARLAGERSLTFSGPGQMTCRPVRGSGRASAAEP